MRTGPSIEVVSGQNFRRAAATRTRIDEGMKHLYRRQRMARKRTADKMRQRRQLAVAAAVIIAAAGEGVGVAALGIPGGRCPSLAQATPAASDVARRIPSSSPWRHQSASNPLRESRLFRSNRSIDGGEPDDGDSSPADPRDELAPPVFSLTRKSLLFDESSTDPDPNEASDDSMVLAHLGKEAGSLTLAVWSGAKAVLPPASNRSRNH